MVNNMNKYNDVVTFETNKKDIATAKKVKKFVLFGGIFLSCFIAIIVIVVTVLRKEVDTRIQDLSFDSGIISPTFSSDVYKYKIETDSDDIFFTCKPRNKKVKVDGCGKTIQLGEKNNIKIVASYKKMHTTYTFEVIKNSKFSVDITGNSHEWTDKDITLEVNAQSLEGTLLNDEAYSFDDGETWQKENKKTFSSNGTVKIRVRDIEGNVSAAFKEKISKIDKVVPKVKLSIKKKKLTAMVTPDEAPSGYIYTWYFNGEEIKKANKVNYTAKESGNYKVKITTGIGKSVESEEILVTTGTSYTVKYDANGGVEAPSDQIKVKDEDLFISSKSPIRSGYKFKGWSVSKNGEVDYSLGDKYVLNQSLILYAVWEKNKTQEDTYSIYYNVTGGSNAPVTQTKEKNKSITISNTIPTKANYQFMGWSVTNGGNVSYKPGAVYNENKTITLYAVWKQTKTITVTYKGNGADIGKSQASTTGTNTFTLPNIKRSGYQILGWATSQTATSATYKVGQKVTFNDSVTLYAITTKEITATFQKNTASKISKTKDTCRLYNKGTLCTVTTPTITPKSGKKVVGWAIYPNSSSASFPTNAKIAISSNTVLYAVTK